MLQDLDSLAERLQQLVTRMRALQTECTQQQNTIQNLQRERDALRALLAQREAECAENHAKLAQHAQETTHARQQHAAELAILQTQATRAREQWQQDLFQCQGERDQAITQWQSSLARSQHLHSAAQQAHDLVDTLLVRLPDTGEE